jgi:hypothetical protein
MKKNINLGIGEWFGAMVEWYTSQTWVLQKNA